jgi:hypothetical protein
MTESTNYKPTMQEAMKKNSDMYLKGRAHGEREVLKTLGMTQSIYEHLKELKASGTSVQISYKTFDPLDLDGFFEDKDFHYGSGTDKVLDSGATFWGQSAIGGRQGPGAGTAYGYGQSEANNPPEREYDTGDPWNHPLDGNPPRK